MTPTRPSTARLGRVKWYRMTMSRGLYMSNSYPARMSSSQRLRAYDLQRATLPPPTTSSSRLYTMPSSKGEPTDPELREQVKEEVKAEEKGGGKGSWSAWKAGEMARRYEAQGGDYKDTGDNKNKAKKGEPEKK
ncbi:hypothetical protein EJ03DRAFT_373279 [Teratosphaeria nubilosa]|uniref:Uncharacterized protein n=1 Tax=Teratosphaeria nubilosa TaxID=161662 RepID=A0A6G1LDM7_9PEZI|nr:hypothetical protein EJ03DRAFT_373279 [Teratosphaeria nubilosa]